MIIFLWLLGAYLIGSIPASFLIAKIGKGIDIRQHGSGNPGATNVFRVCGPVPGVAAFVLDALKGYVPVFLALRFFGPNAILPPVLVGAAAIIGHMFTVFLRFKGGKGVATGAGTFFAMFPWPTIYAFILFWIVLLLTGYVSLGSIVAAVFLPLFCWFTGVPAPLSIVATIVSIIIVFKHRKNIRNLCAGTEYKFGRKKTQNNIS